jgi:hypothetical protein
VGSVLIWIVPYIAGVTWILNQGWERMHDPDLSKINLLVLLTFLWFAAFVVVRITRARRRTPTDDDSN